MRSSSQGYRRHQPSPQPLLSKALWAEWKANSEYSMTKLKVSLLFGLCFEPKQTFSQGGLPMQLVWNEVKWTESCGKGELRNHSNM